jgi:hypothetical protein
VRANKIPSRLPGISYLLLQVWLRVIVTPVKFITGHEEINPVREIRSIQSDFFLKYHGSLAIYYLSLFQWAD